MQPTRQMHRASIERSSGLTLAQLLPNKMLALGNHLAVLLSLLVARKLASQSALGELAFASATDLLHTLHGVNRRRDEVAVVFDGGVALLRELRQHERRVHDHFLATAGAVRLGPFQLAGLALHLEVLVAFGPTESE